VTDGVTSRSWTFPERSDGKAFGINSAGKIVGRTLIVVDMSMVFLAELTRHAWQGDRVATIQP